MNCCQCQGIEDLFSEAFVQKELAHYRSRGPDRTTRLLINALKLESVRGLTLLDIGGGLGAIQHEMLSAGIEHATEIEASAAYLSAAKAEARRRGMAERVTFEHGNFVELAEHIPPADIVTLDRVICCFDDMESLVGLSVARAGKLYGLVYPRDTWWVKGVLTIQNFFFKVLRRHYRAYVHATADVEAIVNGNGFRRRFYRKTLAWQVVVYAR